MSLSLTVYIHVSLAVYNHVFLSSAVFVGLFFFTPEAERFQFLSFP